MLYVPAIKQIDERLIAAAVAMRLHPLRWQLLVRR